MRADRLISALLLLQQKGQVTAAEVATELEISTRTARRDLEALAMSGVPLYSQAGRGGGWRLIGGAKTDLTGLSSNEARALFLALGHQGATNPMLEAALRKLVVALPEGFRDDAVAATEAIRVDPTGWSQIGPAPQPMFVDVMSEAVIAGRQVDMRYATPGNEATNRTVHPLGLVTKRGIWYLVANTDRGIRTFRLSRVERVDVLDEAVERPDDFDLDAAWATIVTTVQARFVGIQVTARVDAAVLKPLRYVFANRHEIVSEHEDGSVEMTISETTPESLGAQLAGFAGSIELIDPPPEVEHEMKRIAAELSAQWLS